MAFVHRISEPKTARAQRNARSRGWRAACRSVATETRTETVGNCRPSPNCNCLCSSRVACHGSPCSSLNPYKGGGATQRSYDFRNWEELLHQFVALDTFFAELRAENGVSKSALNCVIAWAARSSQKNVSNTTNWRFIP